MNELSTRDDAILNCVFNPHLPLEAALTDTIILKDEEEDTPEILKAKKLEFEAVTLAEKGNVTQAIKLLNEALQIAPQKPSLYNNRGHILQFQRKFEDALTDVNTAISLAKGTKLSKTLCKAHVQRGVLHRRKGDVEKARNDFKIAAEMGDVFAKNQIVELNPYAALCNQMLRQVMETLK